MALSTWSFAWKVVAERVSANAALKMAREAGVGMRRNDFLALVGQVRVAYANKVSELDKPLNRRPRGNDITPFDTKGQKGFIAHVDIWVREKGSGEITRLMRSMKTDSPWSRQTTIDHLVDKERNAIARTSAEGSPFGTLPDVEVVGALYTGVYELRPRA